MFFPWRGIFEQISLSDIYVHYDDVQFPLGRSFMSRIQIKTLNGVQWLTIPVIRNGIEPINKVLVDNTQNWRHKHLKTLEQSYNKAPYFDDMINIVDLTYKLDTHLLAELNCFAIEKISDYFGLKTSFRNSSELMIPASSSEKLLKIVQLLKGNIYITGHGARNYLDYMLFEKNEIRVEYMDYKRSPYPQLYGDFDPHVTILDLIANTGKEGFRWLDSGTVHWREFINE